MGTMSLYDVALKRRMSAGAGGRGGRADALNHLRAAHKEHRCRVHAEHPQLRGNTEDVDNEDAHGSQVDAVEDHTVTKRLSF